MATSYGTAVAKSGWMYRQSSVLKKWRRYYFSMTVDGMFRYFETEFETKSGDAILIPLQCVAIRIGTNVLKVKPPEGISEKCLMSLETTNGKTWVMCGESEDDIKAWQLTLEEARHILHQVRASSAPPCMNPYIRGAQQYVYVDDYSGRYGYPNTSVTYATRPPVIYQHYPGQVLYMEPQQTVIYSRDRSSFGPLGGAATGLIAGAALGSLMWSPFLFSPFLWC